ncbi:MAG: cell wall-binding repeat-containing protein [Firmicutes bacterium]|nr:cell wall-binding repeat-containing protein [Bacillota bacterium]
MPWTVLLPRIRRAWAAVAAAGCLPLTQLVPAYAATPPAATVLSGADRFATAAQIAAQEFPQGAATALVAVGDDAHLVDALTAAPLAAALHAPILLATSTSALGAAAIAALASLQVHNLILIGAAASLASSGALPPGIQVAAILSGADRYQTAAAIAGDLAQATSQGAFSTAFLASGASAHLVDALTASPPAASLKAPILLIPPDATALPAEEARWLASTATVYAVGAAASVEPNGLTGRWVALQGADRFATDVAVTRYFARGPWRSLVLASAAPEHLADALAGGPLVASQGAALLLVPPSGALPSATAAYLSQPGAFQTTSITVLGGELAISSRMLSAVEALLSQTPAQLTLSPPSGALAGQLIEMEPTVANAFGQPIAAPVQWAIQGPPGAATAFTQTSSGGLAWVADQAGTYTVTARLGALTASTSLSLGPSPALAPSQIYLYAASAPDLASAQALASAHQIPADHVLSSFSAAMSVAQQPGALLIAIGSPAANGLAYNPCGWSPPPSSAPATLSPYPSGVGVSQPTSGYFLNANGATAQDSDALADAFLTFALGGAWPGSQTLPAQAAPQAVCQGSAAMVSTPAPAAGSSRLTGMDADQSLLPALRAGQIGPGTPYQFVARYLGGPCYRSTPLSAAEANALHSAGLRLITIYSGANHVPGEAVCGTQTQSQGTLDGQRAVTEAQQVGQPPGTAIYLDLEPFQTGSQWLAYVQGWTTAVAAQGYLPGVYSGPIQLQTIASQPWGGSRVLYWVTQWNYGGLREPPPNPTSQMPLATLWQYAGNVPGPTGITDTVDLDSATSATGMW